MHDVESKKISFQNGKFIFLRFWIEYLFPHEPNFISEVISTFEPKLSSFELLCDYFILVSIAAEKKVISPHFTTELLTL